MKFVCAALVAAAASLAVAAGSAGAAANTYCIGGTTVAAGNQTADMNSTPETAAFVFDHAVTLDGGIIDVLVSESPGLNMSMYSTELSYSDVQPTYTYADETITAGACGGSSPGSAGAATTAAPPPPNNVFLCYSAYQTTPGVWPVSMASGLMASGYWSPWAVPGDASGGTNVGSYHLVCNLAAGQSADGRMVTDGGYATGADLFGALKGTPGWYPLVP